MRTQRGRPSLASTLATAVLPGQRPEPPEGLEPVAAGEWCAITGRLPPDFFPREVHPVLQELCEVVALSRRVAADLNALPRCSLADSEAFAQFDKLAQLKLRLGAQIGALSTKLRITNQSRYAKHTAARQAAAGANHKRPWEVAAVISASRLDSATGRFDEQEPEA
jgi:hypothetical protein